MEVSNDALFSTLQEDNASHLDSGMFIDCNSEYSQAVFCLFKMIFFVISPGLFFVTIATRKEHRLQQIFQRIWPSLVYLWAIHASLT